MSSITCRVDIDVVSVSGFIVAPDVLGQMEKALLKAAIDGAHGNQSAAARILGITRYALRYRMKKHGLPLGGG